MIHTGKLFALLPAAALAACATTSANEPGTPDTGNGETAMCDPAAAQSYVGQKATAQVGEQILDATGARQLRWGPPRAAFTMDFRQDRVNVMYDDAMTITQITCG
ncbi:I78 family peptidase inhibitor [Altererythrobacter sp. C41]|uniref:I78 family peptidase inhibitor n=1 Tax=Altererythrobacter sp. C41 TaxID=2806021 RepID=UPI0019332487|nr:I78 family peptidase inhibitor [Altererythrobacter sp. C41]MBM0169716.1 hypothetical protein [Altererythrobacter sp. C41]